MSDEKLDLILNVVSHIKNRQESLEKTVGEMNTRQTTLEKTVGEINTRQATLEKTVGEMNTRQTTLEKTVGEMNLRQTNIERTVGEMNLRQANLESTVGKMDSNLDNLSSEFSAYRKQVAESFASLQNRFAVLEKQMFAIGVEIKAEIKREIESVVARIDRLEKQIIYDRGETLENKDEIREINKRLAAIENNIGI